MHSTTKPQRQQYSCSFKQVHVTNATQTPTLVTETAQTTHILHLRTTSMGINYCTIRKSTQKYFSMAKIYGIDKKIIQSRGESNSQLQIESHAFYH